MIINGAAYGQDATYNAVRLAASMAKRDGVSLRVLSLIHISEPTRPY